MATSLCGEGKTEKRTEGEAREGSKGGKEEREAREGRVRWRIKVNLHPNVKVNPPQNPNQPPPYTQH